MSIIRQTLLSLTLTLLSAYSGQLDAGWEIYKDDRQFVQIDAPATSEGFVSYLDPDTSRKLNFFTENAQSAVKVGSNYGTATYWRTVRISDTATYMVTILSDRRLEIMNTVLADKGKIVYQTDIVASSQTNTRCIDVVLEGEWAYVLCITPGASSAQDSYLVKAFRFLNTGTTQPKEYIFSPKDANTALTREQGSIRVVETASKGILLLAFNRLSLKSLNASIDVNGDKTKFVYTIDIDQTTTRHLFVDLAVVDKKGGTDKIATFAAVYDIRVIRKGAIELVHVLLSRGDPKTPYLYTFEFGGTAAARSLVNWVEKVQLSAEQLTYSAQFCHDPDTFCVLGMVNTTPTKQIYQYKYDVDGTTADFTALANVIKMPSYLNWFPIQFQGCHIVNTNFWSCTQIYLDMPTDAGQKLAVFELFLIDRSTATPSYKMDRIFRSNDSIGGFQVYNGKPVALIVEGTDFLPFLIEDTAATNKKNFLIFNAFRYATSQTSPLKIKKLVNLETSSSDVDVVFKMTDYNANLTSADVTSTTKITAFVNTEVAVPLPLEKVQGYGLRYEITDTNWNATIFHDNLTEIFNATSHEVPKSGVQYYFFGKILVTHSRTQPGPLKFFDCATIRNVTAKKLQLNCTFKEEMASFTGTLLASTCMDSDFVAMLFSTSSTAAVYVTFNKTIKSKSLTENIQSAMFKRLAPDLFLGYVYKDATNKNIAKLVKNDKDGSDLTIVSASANTLFTDNVWLGSVPDGISMYLLDERTSDGVRNVVKLKQEASDKKLFVEDTKWDVSHMKRETGKKLGVCFSNGDRFMYWYVGTTTAGYLNMKYEVEFLSLGLPELGITEIQNGYCTNHGNAVIVGKTTEDTKEKSVAYNYQTNGDMTLASKRLLSFRSDFGRVVEATELIASANSLNFGGYNGNEPFLRILNTSGPWIVVNKNTTGTHELTIKVFNKIKSIDIKYSFNLIDYTPSNYKSSLVEGKQIDSNKTYSLDSMINLSNVPVLTADLVGPNDQPVTMAVVKPRLRFNKLLDQTASRRVLVEGGLADTGRHRLLQNNQQLNLPVFMKTKDNITLAVYETSAGTQGHIYNDSDVFERNFDFQIGTSTKCPTMDFTVEKTTASKLYLHIVAYCSDSNLMYFKFGVDKHDTIFSKIVVQTLSSVTSTHLELTRSIDSKLFIAYLFNTKDTKLKLYGIKINEGTSTAAFTDVHTVDKGRHVLTRRVFLGF